MKQEPDISKLSHRIDDELGLVTKWIMRASQAEAEARGWKHVAYVACAVAVLLGGLLFWGALPR